MHIAFLVEEPSVEAALNNLVPAMVEDKASFSIHVYQGKQGLLRMLPDRLRGYKRWLPEGWRVFVLIDEDRKDCHELKARLEQAARNAGLATKSSPGFDGKFRVVNRLAIEELEAWFFGDVPALLRAYPRLPANLDRKAKYRDPDAIAGGTSEALERVLQRAGYYAGGMPKIQVAQETSRHMSAERNTSHSFQVFREGLLACIS